MVAPESATRPPRTALVPSEALWFGAISPPIIMLLLDSSVTRWEHREWGWEIVARSLTAITLYTNVLLFAQSALFNVGLTRLPLRRLARPLRFILYALTSAAVVTVCTLLLAPVLSFISRGMARELVRLDVQGILISYLWLGGTYTCVEFSRRIGQEQRRAHREQLAALDARVRMLQVRTNPHFLYNSLNTVMSLIATDPELAEETLGRLSSLFRYSLEGSARLVVPLGDEIDAVADYLLIEKIRFQERLRYEIRVDGSLRTVKVPPMLLQPLVENAVKHGVSRRVEGGSVTLRGQLDGDDLLLAVLDDGPGPDRSSHRGTGTSMMDLRERLRLLYGEDGRLRTGVGAGGGFLAELRIPARWDQ